VSGAVATALALDGKKYVTGSISLLTGKPLISR
jgi:hypothetical protein